MKNIFLTALGIFLGTWLFAQDAKKAVILINGVPTEVNLSADGSYAGGTTVPNHMNGYAKPPANLGRTKTSDPIVVDGTRSKISDPNKIITFSENQVSLDEAGMQKLEALIPEINAATKGYVLLRSAFKKTSSTSDIMAQKRVYACKKYLELREVAPNKILISLEPGNVDSKDVGVFIR